MAFSVDSQKIAEHFNLPVVNMGLHFGLGLRFILNEVRLALGAGDSVVIFPEYEHFYSESLNGSPLELGLLAKSCRECISAMTSEQILISANGILQLMEKTLLQEPISNEVYTRHGFDQWGDMIAHLDQPDKKRLLNVISPIKIIDPNPAVDELNLFYKSCKANNIKVFFMFPAIPIYEYDAQKENFNALYNFLKEKLEIPILGTPEDFVYPKKMFYDTVYHINRVGRVNRTERIIDFLTPVFQNVGN